MRRTRLACLYALLSIVMIGCTERGTTVKSEVAAGAEPQSLEMLARCLTDDGWVMYSSFTCSACRLQKEIFGVAIDYIQTVECNPNADDAEPERCLRNRIRKTPSWILEQDGKELVRLEGYQPLNVLASQSSCRADASEQKPALP